MVKDSIYSFDKFDSNYLNFSKKNKFYSIKGIFADSILEVGVVKSITESEDVELDPELELFSKGIFSIEFFSVDSGTKTSSSDSEELFGFTYIV